MKKHLFVIAALLSAISGNVYANMPQKPHSFEEMDTNSDGQLSQDEVKGPLAWDFERFDIDGSGTLSADELPEPPNRKPPSFEEMDTDADGELSPDEVQSPLARDFDTLDKDGSGTLTKDELPAPPRHN